MTSGLDARRQRRRTLSAIVVGSVMAVGAMFWLLPRGPVVEVPTAGPDDVVGGLPNSAPSAPPHSGDMPSPPDPSAAAAMRIYKRLNRMEGGVQHPAECLAVQDDLFQILKEVSESDPLWPWAMDIASSCLLLPQEHDERAALLSRLMALNSEHPKVVEALGLYYYQSGSLTQAVDYLDRPANQNSFNAMDALGESKLLLADKSKKEGDTAATQNLTNGAERALIRAIELAPPELAPLVMHKMARVQLRLGRESEALMWADRALHMVNSQWSVQHRANFGPNLYVDIGGIYYWTSQRATGLAYMEQGVSLASAEARPEVVQRRDEVMRRRP